MTNMATGGQVVYVPSSARFETELLSSYSHSEEHSMICKILEWGSVPVNHSLFDCLLDMYGTYRFSVETLHAAVNICVKFHSVCGSVHQDCHNFESTHKLVNQPPLVAATCFWISCKLHEVTYPGIRKIVDILERRCTIEGIRQAELLVLETINWDLYDLTVSPG